MQSRPLGRSTRFRWSRVVLIGLAAACSDGQDATPVEASGPPVSAQLNAPQSAAVGVPFTYDATLGGAAFRVIRSGGLTYSIVFSPSANGFIAASGRISGV